MHLQSQAKLRLRWRLTRALAERFADLARDHLSLGQEALRVVLRHGGFEDLVRDRGQHPLVPVLPEVAAWQGDIIAQSRTTQTGPWGWLARSRSPGT